MKICTSCGHENPDSAKFCGKCGNQLETNSGTFTPPPQKPNATSEPVPQALNVGIIVASVIIPLLGIIMGIIYMNADSQEKKDVGKTWLWVGLGAGVVWCLITIGGGGI